MSTQSATETHGLRGPAPAAWIAIGVGLFTLFACSAYLWVSLTQGFTAV